MMNYAWDFWEEPIVWNIVDYEDSIRKFRALGGKASPPPWDYGANTSFPHSIQNEVSHCNRIADNNGPEADINGGRPRFEKF